ncbi:hypothetical protein BU16DRAFT_522305 [Lophium mytilinum]|uniref:RING-type domain-containing protein n=1 Tax=Lophium mytilinum TaxID=390894 RepID=A0A6A6RD05_9PEZI|nr:hypothetical protein BU16DRAFT_522305 [Lophium mytilinum]
MSPPHQPPPTPPHMEFPSESNQRPILTRRHSMPAHTGTRASRYQWSNSPLRSGRPHFNNFRKAVWDCVENGLSYHRLLMKAEETKPELRTNEQLHLLAVQYQVADALEQAKADMAMSDSSILSADTRRFGLHTLWMDARVLDMLTKFAFVYANDGQDAVALAYVIRKLDIGRHTAHLIEQSDITAELLVAQLNEIDQAARAANGGDVVLENVGPDPEVEKLGELWVVPKPSEDDPSPITDCCFCLQPFSEKEDPAFKLSSCGHCVGKSCMQKWLCSVSNMSHTCPQCREVLLEPRKHRPVPHSNEDAQTRQRQLEIWPFYMLLMEVIRDVFALASRAWPPEHTYVRQLAEMLGR